MPLYLGEDRWDMVWPQICLVQGEVVLGTLWFLGKINAKGWRLSGSSKHRGHWKIRSRKTY
jgi:hypothetical protein